MAGIRTPEHIDDLSARMPEIYDELLDDRRPPRAPLQGHAGHRVHDPGGHALPPADARRQALGGRGGQGGRRPRARGRDRPAHGHPAREAAGGERGDPPGFDDRQARRAIAGGRLLARGLPAAPGAAVGQVVFDADRAVEWAKPGEQVILVRPGDLARGRRRHVRRRGHRHLAGGRTSHAAVVAVGMGKPCVVGAGDVASTRSAGHRRGGGRTCARATSSPSTARPARSSSTPSRPSTRARTRSRSCWLGRPLPQDRRAANADTPEDARKAREFGAEGIGLVRTEHMFFAADRIPIVREMIMASDQRCRAGGAREARAVPARGLHRHLPGHGRAAGDDPPARPAAARVPAEPKEYREMLEEPSRGSTRSTSTPSARRRWTRTWPSRALREANPMLGHRGCRLGITSPRSTACRCGPSWRPPARSPSRASRSSRRS